MRNASELKQAVQSKEQNAWGGRRGSWKYIQVSDCGKALCSPEFYFILQASLRTLEHIKIIGGICLL